MINQIIIGVVVTLIGTFIIWFIRRICQRNDVPKVLVHGAYFLNNPIPFYFVKVQNRSLKRDFTITHIWIEENKKKIHILNNNTPLPYKLHPSDEWETWIEENKVNDHKNVYKNVKVKLSNEKILESHQNKKVPLCNEHLLSWLTNRRIIYLFPTRRYFLSKIRTDFLTSQIYNPPTAHSEYL